MQPIKLKFFLLVLFLVFAANFCFSQTEQPSFQAFSKIDITFGELYHIGNNINAGKYDFRYYKNMNAEISYDVLSKGKFSLNHHAGFYTKRYFFSNAYLYYTYYSNLYLQHISHNLAYNFSFLSYYSGLSLGYSLNEFVSGKFYADWRIGASYSAFKLEFPSNYVPDTLTTQNQISMLLLSGRFSLWHRVSNNVSFGINIAAMKEINLFQNNIQVAEKDFPVIPHISYGYNFSIKYSLRNE